MLAITPSAVSIKELYAYLSLAHLLTLFLVVGFVFNSLGFKSAVNISNLERPKASRIEQVRIANTVAAKMYELKQRLKVLSAKARILLVQVATEKNALFKDFKRDYKMKRNRKKLKGISKLIENHCFTIVYSSDEEENEINGVLTRPKELYEEIFGKKDYVMYNKLLKEDQLACQQSLNEVNRPSNNIQWHYDAGIEHYFALS